MEYLHCAEIHLVWIHCGNLTFFNLRLDLIAWPLATFLINSVFEGGGVRLVKFPGKMMSETQNKVGACLLKSQIARNTKFSADCFPVSAQRGQAQAVSGSQVGEEGQSIFHQRLKPLHLKCTLFTSSGLPKMEKDAETLLVHLCL